MLLPKKIPNGRFKEALSQADLRFVVTSLSSKGTEADSLLHLLTDGGMRDVILDNPKLREALDKQKTPPTISPELHFYLLLRPALKQAGLPSAQVAACVAEALAAFPPAPRPGVHTSDYVEALRQAKDYEWFGLSIELGNRALILSGVYGESIYNSKKGYTVAGLNYYENLGRGCYRAASTHQLAQEFALKQILVTLAEDFNKLRTVLQGMSELCRRVVEGKK